MIKKFLYIYLKKVIFFFIKFIFLKKNKKKLTFISFPDLSDNSWHLFNYINLNKNNLILIWLLEKNLSDKKIYSLKKINKNNKLLFIKKKSLRGIYHFLTSRIVFFTHIPYFFLQKNLGPIQFNLWHGMPIKKVGFYRHKKNVYFYGDYVIATSNLYKKILSKAFNINKNCILKFGLPRNDVLISKSKKFFNKKNLKLILWLPTFRKTNIISNIDDSINENFLEEWPNNFIKNLNYIAKKNKIKLIIKTHPLDNFKKFKNKFSNIIFFENIDLVKLNCDLHDLISVSDGLISDISSVIIDYILMKKPLGLTTNSQKTFRRGLINEVNLFDKLNYHKIKNLKDFEIFFRKIKQNKTKNIDPKNIFYSKNAINSSNQIVEYFNI
jgi:CDP-glycerol glycerophosphotransferase (TagB/SpsB family)